MYRIVFLYALLALAQAGALPANDDFLNGNIINGKDATIREHPYQVTLNQKPGSHFCSGSLINHDTVVTAAHCLHPLKQGEIIVRVGSTRYNTLGQQIAIRAFKLHEGYNTKTFVNDIAVVKLARSVEVNEKVGFIALAEASPETGTIANVTGWDATCSSFCVKPNFYLQAVEVDTVNRRDCASSKYLYGTQIKESMFCANAVNEDECLKDGGSPLVIDNELVGVMSYIKGCTKEGFPSVYSDVAVMRKWILQTAELL